MRKIFGSREDVIFSVTILLLVGLFFFVLTTAQEDGSGKRSTETPTRSEEAAADPTDVIDIVFIDGLPTAVLSGATPTEAQRAVSDITCTNTPTPAPTETPTDAPTATNTPFPTNTPTNTPKPTKKPTATPKLKYKTTAAGEKNVPDGAHSWKPYARHTAITLKTSPQYKLQQMASTDDNGLRYIVDEDGVKRYCVALPVYWAGGTFDDVGRYFDVIMVNGATLHCVLGDIKKIEHSENGEGKFGAHGELLEFQVDQSKLPDIVRKSGDISRLGGAFEGNAKKVIVYDKNIFDK